MSTRLRYSKGYQFFDGNGNPLAFGNLYYYIADTTTPQNTYSDSAGAIPNANPIVLDGSGRLQVDVYLSSTEEYKEVLATSSVTESPSPYNNIVRATSIVVFTGDSGPGGTSGLVPAPAGETRSQTSFSKRAEPGLLHRPAADQASTLGVATGTPPALGGVAVTGSVSVNGYGIPSLISSNTTINVATTGGDFTTVQAALASLDNIVLGAETFITISVADGTYAESGPIIMAGPYGRNINIQGKNTYETNIISVQSSSGSSQNWTIVLNVSSVENISANDYISIYAPSGGILPTYLAGCFKITNVDAVNTRITIASTHRASSAPSGAVTASGLVYKAILSFTGTDGICVWEGGTSLNLSNLAVVGTAVGNGISIQDVGRLYVGSVTSSGGDSVSGTNGYIGVVGFYNGVLALYNSEINDGAIHVSGAAYNGFLIDYGSVVNSTAIATGNSQYGFYATRGGYISLSSGAISSGNYRGFVADNAGNIYAPSSYATGNVNTGYVATDPSYIYNSGSTGGTAAGNGYADLLSLVSKVHIVPANVSADTPIQFFSQGYTGLATDHSFTVEQWSGGVCIRDDSSSSPTFNFGRNGTNDHVFQFQNHGASSTPLTVNTATGSVIVGSAALARSATGGFLYIPTCAGVPTGVPTAQTGTVPIIYDTIDNKLYVYRGGAWAGVAI